MVLPEGAEEGSKLLTCLEDLPKYRGRNPHYIYVYNFETRYQLDFRYCSLFFFITRISSNVFPRHTRVVGNSRRDGSPHVIVVLVLPNKRF
jgi:hypothetical protein